MVNGKAFMIKGMNWDYFPIGTNYDFNLWEKPDSFIKQALQNEMTLLKDMGVNAIRVYSGIPAQWISYIYDNFGIYTMLNHPFGRYGVEIKEEWIPNTDYTDPAIRSTLLKEVSNMADSYKNTRGLLMYLLGNENNYGLFWTGAETEDIPTEDQASSEMVTGMYSLFNEAAVLIKRIDSNHPIALCNGDLQFLGLIVQHCQDVDIFGTNMYRGSSFGDAFQRVKDEYGKPILFTEFGADGFNAKTNSEDQYPQAYYIRENWREIYKNASGHGLAENSIGGFTFQFSDGWWKYGQTRNLSVHDTNASWSNGGYEFDFEEGKNNMNEEWFGICAKEKSNNPEYYTLNPRKAFYTLKEVHQLDVLSENINLKDIDDYFNSINLKD